MMVEPTGDDLLAAARSLVSDLVTEVLQLRAEVSVLQRIVIEQGELLAEHEESDFGPDDPDS